MRRRLDVQHSTRLIGILVALVLCGAPVINASAQGTPAASPVASPSPGATSLAGEPLPWWHDAVCYEIFVRSFADSDGDGDGDFAGLIGKLDYLNDGDPATTTDLGVTCLWLMPIMEAVSYHGYDVTDYYAVERDYGTAADFGRLMTEAHARGIRVVVDLVINHTSVEHPWFQQALADEASPYRDWYIFSPDDPSYLGPWGADAWHESPGGSDYFYGVFWSGMPDLDFRNPAVTAEIEKITAFWLLEMGVDGFRLDAIKHLIEEGRVQESTPATLAWIADYGAFIRATKPASYTVGEIAGAGTDALLPYYPDLLEAYFHFELAGASLNAANFGQARQLAGIASGAADRLPDGRVATFLANHDQPRTGTQLDADDADAKVAATLLLTMPGTPFLYYGEEIGMIGDKPDERIRTPMQWTADPSGFTTGTPWEPFQDDAQTRTVAAQDSDSASLLNAYRRLIQARTTHPALAHGDFTPLESGDPNVFAFLRQDGEQRVLVLVNLGNEPADPLPYTAPAGALSPGAYTAPDALGSPGEISVQIDAAGVVTVTSSAGPLPAKTGLVLPLTPGGA